MCDGLRAGQGKGAGLGRRGPGRRDDDARRLISLASHDLRSPLAVIAAHAENLIGGVHGRLPKGAVPPVRKIRRIALVAAAMAEELLAATAPEGETAATRDVAADLREAAAVLRPTAELREQKILVRVDRRMSLPSPRGWLKAAVRNLVENALAASPPGATVRIEGRKGRGSVRIDVRDRGRGRPDLWTTRPRRGWGLRLVRHIVEEEGGEVLAEPRRGGGLIVGFRLPARRGRRTS